MLMNYSRTLVWCCSPRSENYLANQGCKIGSDGQPEAKEAGSLDTADGCELDFCFGKVERIPDRMRAQAKQVVGRHSTYPLDLGMTSHIATRCHTVPANFFKEDKLRITSELQNPLPVPATPL